MSFSACANRCIASELMASIIANFIRMFFNSNLEFGGKVAIKHGTVVKMIYLRTCNLIRAFIVSETGRTDKSNGMKEPGSPEELVCSHMHLLIILFTSG